MTDTVTDESSRVDAGSGHRHETHPDIIKRLKRADGHLRSIIEMIESERACLDIAQQLHAVEKAVCEAKRVLIRDHIDHCLDEAVGSTGRDQRRTLDEFKAITKYL
ncbi:metal-sensing transcriptional repressor [Acuticoccus kandeliae]|uniref:metal-sensing transcriptional repressor n=1 Tax=Acuticoccus kandeliae TaxID=2073160 RepID=UPI000D3E3AAE|nr:metal-sensing transcriptional repressor [Acuticoccus kandeliae]